MRSFHRPPVPDLAEPVGTLKLIAGGNPPAGYLICDGSEVDPEQYPDLAAFLGGDPPVLPDFRDRALVGAGGQYAAGDAVGQDVVEPERSDDRVEYSRVVKAKEATQGTDFWVNPWEFDVDRFTQDHPDDPTQSRGRVDVRQASRAVSVCIKW